MKKSEVRVGFAGFGNMAAAIAEGLLKSGSLLSKQLFASAVHLNKLKEKSEKYGIHACSENRDCVDHADVVILAVKPHQVPEVMKEIGERLANKLLVSVAYGITLSELQSHVPNSCGIVCTVPNTPISVAKGILCCRREHTMTEEMRALFEEIFLPCADIHYLDDKAFRIAGALSGCAPAFVAMCMEALADAGVKHGLPRALAYELVSEVFEGTAKYQLESGKHPAVLKDEVCSPGGTTIRGVAALEENGLRHALFSAVDAVSEK